MDKRAVQKKLRRVLQQQSKIDDIIYDLQERFWGYSESVEQLISMLSEDKSDGGEEFWATLFDEDK